jgi:hypothetical protein
MMGKVKKVAVAFWWVRYCSLTSDGYKDVYAWQGHFYD